MINLYYDKTIKVEGNWIESGTDNLIRSVNGYDVDLAPIYAELISAVKDKYIPEAYKKLIEIMDIIKSYCEESNVNRKTIITVSDHTLEELTYSEDFFRLDLTVFSSVFILNMISDEENEHMIITFSRLDLLKHKKARFIATELTALCKRINENVNSLEYFYTEENDLENRRLEGDEYCFIIFGYSRTNALITGDSLSAITADVLRKI